ncbi:MAG: hypothetical protein JWO19_5664 [Bryobacterales bacterium]|jgi:hypothetical protein|nr:hypothetical protein [Bryobacterales bacterium]
MKTGFLLILTLAISSCVKTPPGPKIDPALAALIPPDTILLAGARLDQLQKTPIYQKYLANRPVPVIDDFPKQIGLQVRREDLWELLLISDGKQSVVLGRGKFANEAEPRIERPGATRFGYKGYTLVGDEREAVLLVSPTVIGVGPTAALRSLIDNKGKGNGPPLALAEQIKVMPAEAVFWAVYGGGLRSLPFDLPGDMANINKIIASIQSGSAYLDLRMGVNGLATGTCSSEQDAKSLYDALRALMGLGRLAVPKGQPGKDQPEIGRILDGLRITQESHKVNIHIEEPEELVGTLLDLWLGPTR